MPTTRQTDKTAPRYDRTVLLSAWKRNQVLALWEAQRHG
jgi:hypothetical protein